VVAVVAGVVVEVEVVEVAAVQAGGVVMVLASSDTAPLRAKTRVTGSEP
jgi:multidrug resistance efflux pump